MANRIKGITVEIGGDTSGLTKSLNSVNKEINSTQSQLKDVNKLLKLDPTNTELVAQKQKLLKQAIEETKTKLETLKGAQQDLNIALENGDITQEQYDAWQREIVATKTELKNLEQQVKDTDSVIQKTLKEAGRKVTEVGDKINDTGKTLTKNVTTPIVAVGAAAMLAFNEVDSGYDTIVKKTGAAGDALESLQASADNVFKNMPTDMENVGIAIGEVNTRFGVTGMELEELSAKFIKFAEINDTDLNTSIGNTNKIMKQWEVNSREVGNVLGIITSKAQETGISVDELMNSVQDNGAVFKEMGFNLGQSVEMLAQFEQNGVNADVAIAGLKKAVTNYAKQGLSMEESLQATIDSIKNASTQTQALTIATSIFGTKGANEMTKAIREGRISIDDLSGSMKAYGNTVEDTYEGTLDGIDNLNIAMNNSKLAMAQLGTAISDVIGPILASASEKIKAFSNWFSSLDTGTKETIVKIAMLVAAIGPLLVVIGTVISSVGTIITATAYDLLTLACKECNVTLAHSQNEMESMANGTQLLGIYTDNDIETWRDLIFYTAQVLGRFATINREGKLELRKYGNNPVMNISSKHRFSSSFSDFVIGYSAINSTNIKTQESEYYSLKEDNALTMNLGVNPLLQFGLKETRKELITNILDMISAINYVPFDSTTIGNPALDLGDIITFSGGHADEKQITCITGYNYKINGKHRLCQL